MSSLHVPLSDDILARLRERAVEGGYASVEAYAQAVLREQAEPGVVDEDVEAVLVERLTDGRPALESSPELWADLKARVEAQVRLAGKVAS